MTADNQMLFNTNAFSNHIPCDFYAISRRAVHPKMTRGTVQGIFSVRHRCQDVQTNIHIIWLNNLTSGDSFREMHISIISCFRDAVWLQMNLWLRKHARIAFSLQVSLSLRCFPLPEVQSPMTQYEEIGTNDTERD